MLELIQNAEEATSHSVKLVMKPAVISTLLIIKMNCLQELIQNAEDAGARTVKVATDTRCFHRQVDSETLRKHPHLRYLQVRPYTESASVAR